VRGWQAWRRLSAIAVVAALAGVGAAATLGSDGSKTRSPSTRAVQVALGTPERRGEVATGFAAGPGRVVTVAHLFEAADGASVRVRDRGRWLAARVLRRDRRADLALLEVPRLRARRVRLGSADNGGARLLLGARSGPGERPAEIRRAIVAHMRTPGGAASFRRPALELAARVSVGDSGAAVVAHTGEVVGVVFARSRRRAGKAYAVDASALRALLEGGRDGGHPALGPHTARLPAAGARLGSKGC
jgi:S1-C subfamily serine protease